MVNRPHKILFIVLFLILLSSRVYAINLGSVSKNKVAEISTGKSAKFTMLFWNVESEPYIVKLSVSQAPEDWIIIIDPDEFILNRSIGEQYIKVPYEDQNVRAKVVNIFVKPNDNSIPNNYKIIIRAESHLSQDGGRGIVIIPERLFSFNVNLDGFTVVETVEEEITELSEQGFENQEEIITKYEDQLDKNYFYLALMFVVVIASFVIYRKM